jgi:hypothetical protein
LVSEGEGSNVMHFDRVIGFQVETCSDVPRHEHDTWRTQYIYLGSGQLDQIKRVILFSVSLQRRVPSLCSHFDLGITACRIFNVQKFTDSQLAPYPPLHSSKPKLYLYPTCVSTIVSIGCHSLLSLHCFLCSLCNCFQLCTASISFTYSHSYSRRSFPLN